MSPNYLAFKRVYPDDLIHYGVKRRSGRYPWGSGDRPYQSDAKKAIDRGVRNINTIHPAYKQFPKSHQIAIATEHKERIFRDNYEKITDTTQRLQDMTEDFTNYENSQPYKEIKSAVKSTDFKRELDERLRDAINNGREVEEDVFYQTGLKLLTDKRREYMPDTSKLFDDISKLEIEYLKTIESEIRKILDDTKGIGSQRIKKIRDEYITYGDVIEQIIKNQSNRSWSDYADGEIFRYEFDALVDLYNEEYLSKSKR